MKGIVVIPTYNEKENIRHIIAKIFEVKPDFDILIVDDNSPDGTGQIVKEMQKDNTHVQLMERKGKMGLGSAYVEGFKFAVQHGYDFVVQMDADFSHNPESIPLLVEKLDNYDLVIGSRYVDGISVVNWPLSRLFLSYFANIYARVVTGVPVNDLTGGFKCIKRKVLEAINLDEINADGYGFQIEVNFLAYERGFRIVEVPIIFIDRRAGTSKMSKNIVWEAFWLVWKLRFRKCFGRKKH